MRRNIIRSHRQALIKRHSEIVPDQLLGKGSKKKMKKAAIGNKPGRSENKRGLLKNKAGRI